MSTLDSTEFELDLERASLALATAKRVTALTGAGASAESGIPTFRGSDGLWEGHSIEEVATPQGFARDAQLVWRFYNLRRTTVKGVEPNPGHHTLSTMEDHWGTDSFAIVTQNIDGLHQRAGSQHVLEVHGSLSRVKCSACSFIEDRPGIDLPELPECPECDSLLRPDVVWFGEMLPEDIWSQSVKAVSEADCLLVVGTSAVVYPAAGLIDMGHALSTPIIEINLEQTSASRGDTIGLYGPSGEILPRLWERTRSKMKDS